MVGSRDKVSSAGEEGGQGGRLFGDREMRIDFNLGHAA